METLTEVIPDKLQGLKRNKLQSLCKKYGIPANLKVSFCLLNLNTLSLQVIIFLLMLSRLQYLIYYSA